MGPNGSGKTTLINCITGIYKPDKGKIKYNGIDITGKPPWEIVDLGIGRSFQVPENFRGIALNETLLACCRGHPGENLLTSFFKDKWIQKEEVITQKLLKFLKMFDLYSQRNILTGELSGGQSKITEFVKLLMTESKLCIFDEPVGSIHPILAHKIFSHMKKETHKKTFIVVEHRLDIAFQYVDHVYVLADGKIIYEGEPEDVKENKKVHEVYF